MSANGFRPISKEEAGKLIGKEDKQELTPISREEAQNFLKESSEGVSKTGLPSKPTSGDVGIFGKKIQQPLTSGEEGLFKKRIQKPLSEKKPPIEEALKLSQRPGTAGHILTGGLSQLTERLVRLPVLGIKGMANTPIKDNLSDFFYKDLNPSERETAERLEDLVEMIAPEFFAGQIAKGANAVLRSAEEFGSDFFRRKSSYRNALDRKQRLYAQRAQEAEKAEPQKNILEKVQNQSENLPANQREILENVLEKLQSGEEENIQKAIADATQEFEQRVKSEQLPEARTPEIPETPTEGYSIAPERISEPQDVGLRPSAVAKEASPEEQLGRNITQYKFQNSTEGGEGLKELVTQTSKYDRRFVDESWNNLRELSYGLDGPAPRLVNFIQNELNSLESPAFLSPTKQRYRNVLRDLLGRTAAMDETGRFATPRVFEVSSAIDTIQEINQLMDDLFVEGKQSNIFRRLQSELGDFVRDVGANQRPELEAAFDNARALTRQWGQTYQAKNIAPFRNPENRNFTRLFEKAHTVDDYRQLEPILDKSTVGKQAKEALKRKIVEDKLGKYIDNPDKHPLRSFQKDLSEIEPILSEEEAKEVRDLYRKELTKKQRKVQKISKENLSEKADAIREKHKKQFDKSLNEIEKTRKYKDLTPEKLEKKMDSITGLRELKNDLTAEEFQKLAEIKIRDIMWGDKISPEQSFTKLLERLEKRSNFEIMEELIGKENTDGLLKILREESPREQKRNNLKKFAKDAAKMKGKREAVKSLIKVLKTLSPFL